MAKKRSIHELIEEQEPEAKQRMWEEVRLRITKEDILGEDTSPSKKFSWKKFGTIAASFVLVLGITLFSVFYFLPHEPISRYCTQADYTIEKINETIKEHSVKEQKNWIFLDWYDIAESCENRLYYLNNSGEEICFSEDIINGETGEFIKIFITDNYTDLDVLENIKESCIKLKFIDNYQIKWGSNNLYSYALFVYNNYRYYLELEDPMTETAILDIVEELLP